MKSLEAGHMRHSPELQGLRAIFILMVLVGHYVIPFRDVLLSGEWLHVALYHVANITWMGVDLFFTLSGFVVTLLLLKSDQTYVHFMKRRAVRLLPAYYGSLLAVGIATVVIPILGGSVRDGFATDQLWAWGLLANVAASMQAGVLDGGSVSLMPTWSLCVEIQFYLLWPFVVWRFRDRGLVSAMCALAAAALVARGVMSYHEVWYNTISSLTPLRIDQFAFGGIAAVLAARRDKVRDASWFAGMILVPLLVALLIIPHWHKAIWWVHTLGYSLLGMGTAALVLAAYQETLWKPLSRLLASRPLVLLGDRSYSLYLWHLPFHGMVTSAVQASFAGYGRTTEIALVVIFNSAVALVLTEVSYRLLERRFLKR